MIIDSFKPFMTYILSFNLYYFLSLYLLEKIKEIKKILLKQIKFFLSKNLSSFLTFGKQNDSASMAL